MFGWPITYIQTSGLEKIWQQNVSDQFGYSYITSLFLQLATRLGSQTSFSSWDHALSTHKRLHWPIFASHHHPRLEVSSPYNWMAPSNLPFSFKSLRWISWLQLSLLHLVNSQTFVRWGCFIWSDAVETPLLMILIWFWYLAFKYFLTCLGTSEF